MIDNRKKTALVTGASSGMGKEIAKRLIADGFRVYVAARSVDKMTDLEKIGARALQMDISDDNEVQAAVSTILTESGGVDVLVNNAGFGLYGPVEDILLDEARYQFEVNVFGPARLTQLLLPAMRQRGAGTTSPRWAARSIRCSAPGIMPPSMPSKAGRTACGWNWHPSASMW
jgi:NAD(P)-dependent dehydrogenase (short-subunit alcohol dehydrogenase family)